MKNMKSSNSGLKIVDAIKQQTHICDHKNNNQNC